MHRPPQSSPTSSDGGYLSTKRVVPQLPPRPIDRTRLLDQLDAAVSASPVTLLRASAGSGKSALVSAWARSERPPGPVAWLTLSSTDSRRGRFWRQVFLTLAETNATPEIAQLAVPSPAAVDVLLVSLLGALTGLDRPVVLVLDDLHEVDDEEIMEDLRMLLRRPPDGLRLILSTRRDPPLRLQRLRLAGTLAEIPDHDLHFTPQEAGSLLSASGVALGEADTQRLWARTEGWAAGLALTAHALREHEDPEQFVDAFAGDVAPVADYLLEEVLAEQSPRVREFLLETSILTTVCGDLADAITVGTGSAVLLERLHHGGVLTTAMDDHREWYRYHGLLADLLRAVVRREQPELVPVLHARAARWLADHDYPIAAARHAVAAGDIPHVVEIAAASAFALLLRGEINELAAILGELPATELRSRPVLALTMAGAALETGDAGQVARWSEIAAARADDVLAHQRERFETALVLIRLYEARYTGDVGPAFAVARPIVETVERSPVSGGSDLAGVILINLGALELWTGNLRVAGRELDRGVAIAMAGGHRYLAVYGMAHQSVHRMWSGELPQAEQLARDTLELAEAHGWRGTGRAAVALLILSVGASIHGRLDEARTLLEEARSAAAAGLEQPLYAHAAMHAAHLLRLGEEPDAALAELAQMRRALVGSAFLLPMEGALAMHEALALLAVGRPDDARAVLGAAQAISGTGEAPVTMARVELEAGDAGEAIALAAPWMALDASKQLESTRVHAHIVVARAHYARGETQDAAAALERALELAERHARRLPFVEQGADFLGQLRGHIAGGTAHRALAGEIERLLDERDPDRSAPAPVPPSDELSVRELAVLRFLPTMLSNREIAEELIVSVNTVKTHLKQIYSKLDAHDRRDAVRRARDLGLL